MQDQDKILNLTSDIHFSGSHPRDLNPRPAHYECAALPTELRWQLFSPSLLYQSRLARLAAKRAGRDARKKTKL